MVRGGGERSEVRLAGLLPDRAADTADVFPGVCLHRLDAGLALDRVVVLPAEDLVREQVEVLVDPKAAAREHFVQGDPVGLVGLPGDEMVLHRVRELA